MESIELTTIISSILLAASLMEGAGCNNKSFSYFSLLGQMQNLVWGLHSLVLWVLASDASDKCFSEY